MPEAPDPYRQGRFTDSDLVSLICPQPLLVEQGKADGIAWWPMISLYRWDWW